MKTKHLLLCLPLVLASCNNSDDDNTLDTTKPSVEIALPKDDQEIELGSKLNLQAVIGDNKELASYKIEVHSAEDGHTHTHAKKSEKQHFSYEMTEKVSGKLKTIIKDIDIPENIEEGHYHLGVIVIDAAGNQNEQFITIHLGEEHGHDHDHDHGHDHHHEG